MVIILIDHYYLVSSSRMTDPNAKKLFWFLFAGSSGGIKRILIIDLLIQQPYNINQLAEIFKIDYKAVLHHIRVLEKNNLITKSGEKYGILYFISNYLEVNMDAFIDVKSQIDKKKGKK